MQFDAPRFEPILRKDPRQEQAVKAPRACLMKPSVELLSRQSVGRESVVRNFQIPLCVLGALGGSNKMHLCPALEDGVVPSHFAIRSIMSCPIWFVPTVVFPSSFKSAVR